MPWNPLEAGGAPVQLVPDKMASMATKDARAPHVIPPSLGVLVGRNVRRIRASRGMSASDLARAADVSRGTLTDLEGGRGNPTVDTVAALARVLGVPVTDLLTDVPGTQARVVRAGHGAAVQQGTVTFRLLHRIEAQHALFETWEARLTRGRHQAAPLPLGTILHAYVVSGAARLGPLDDPVDVAAGDAVLYRADTPALFACRVTTVLSLVVAYAPSGAPEALSTALSTAPSTASTSTT
jgi:transcriptional regulator with XRE-family HTH domain